MYFSFRRILLMVLIHHFNGIEGCLINDGRVEIISEEMSV